MRSGAGAPATGRSSGPVGGRIPDISRVRHPSDDPAVHVYLSCRVGAKDSLSCSASVNMDTPVGLSLIQSFSCLEKSGFCMAVDTVATVCGVHSGNLACIWNHYFSGDRGLGGRNAIYGCSSLAVPARLPDFNSPVCRLYNCLLCALVGGDRAELYASA